MTPEQVTLIRTSWRQITPVAATAAGLFYERLFALDPALRPLFAHTDMERQGKKLMQALGVVVAAADRLRRQLHAGGRQPGAAGGVGAASCCPMDA